MFSLNLVEEKGITSLRVLLCFFFVISANKRLHNELCGAAYNPQGNQKLTSFRSPVVNHSRFVARSLAVVQSDGDLVVSVPQ